MITISHQGNGYKIKLSNPGTGERGIVVHARFIDELHEAIDHYYVYGSNANKHSHLNAKRKDTCPLCRGD